MSIKGDLREWGVDIHALQHLSQVPPDVEQGALYIDGEPYPPEGGGGEGSKHTIEDEGSSLTERSKLNFVGDGVTVTDDSGDDATVVTIANPTITLSGDLSGSGTTSIAATIGANSVSNSKLANMNANTFKGRITSSGDPQDLTVAQARTILNVEDGSQANTVDSVNSKTGVVVLDPDDLDDSGTANKFNVTHTGEVTGATSLTLSKTAISNRSAVSAASGDYLLIGDASDSDNLKKVLVSSLPITRPVTTLTDAATIAVDASVAVNGIFKATIAGNRTLGAPTGSPADGQTMELWIKQDATGSRTLSYNAIYIFSDSIPEPTLSTTGNDTDILCFQYNSTLVKWMCTSVILGYPG